MEDNQPKTGKIALKYGLIIGIIGIVFNLMLYSQDLHYQIDIKRILFTIGLGLIFIVVGSIIGIKEFKKQNNGYVSFGEGMKIGIGMALISGIIGIIFSFVLTKVIDPEMEQKAIEYATNMMLESGMDPEAIDKQMESQKNPNVLWKVAGGLIFNLFIGFVGSLFPALILKKQKPEY
ncbi:DUF4199 domain-containing protein [Pseudozobellia thermophila]|uniref:DUF4199 domain-containing protein n=1 Tax=Pseudozobellia thermophila TaxID=192903 RepID=A0A1M6FIA4_9FLAO|nr:DUF4199 domain-containing protein [Pseudozobellia thermophila]SHI97430.1 Protein of unknown function [Pseudozobellia thermophila]